MSSEPAIDQAVWIANTRRWVNEFVIGLNLCPFAKRVEESQRIRYVVSESSDDETLLEDLSWELKTLVETSRDVIETTLLICPNTHADFLDFNDLVGMAEELLQDLNLEGTVQLVGFHPGFRFEGTDTQSVENFTNRSPYPMIHLLREDSVTEVAIDPAIVESIPARNTETLKRLGVSGILPFHSLLTKPPSSGE